MTYLEVPAHISCDLATSEFRNFSYETRKHLEFFSENLEQSRPKMLNFEILSPHDQPSALDPRAFNPTTMDLHPFHH